jgi:hypothetical protein
MQERSKDVQEALVRSRRSSSGWFVKEDLRPAGPVLSVLEGAEIQAAFWRRRRRSRSDRLVDCVLDLPQNGLISSTGARRRQLCAIPGKWGRGTAIIAIWKYVLRHYSVGVGVLHHPVKKAFRARVSTRQRFVLRRRSGEQICVLPVAWLGRVAEVYGTAGFRLPMKPTVSAMTR